MTTELVGPALEVDGYDGTLAAAFSEGLLEAPEPMSWNSWQTWRSRVGKKPASRRDAEGTKLEALLWRSTMAELYGDEWRELIGTPSQPRSEVSPPPVIHEDAASNLPAVHRMTPSAPSAISAGATSRIASSPLADLGASQVVARAKADDNASAFSEGSWRGMHDTDLWSMIKAPFDAEVDDISQYERRLLRAQALLVARGLVVDAARLREELQTRMLRTQYQDKYHKVGERADEVMRLDLAECMEAGEDDALAQERAELILDFVQERGGLSGSYQRRRPDTAER